MYTFLGASFIVPTTPAAHPLPLPRSDTTHPIDYIIDPQLNTGDALASQSGQIKHLPMNPNRLSSVGIDIVALSESFVTPPFETIDATTQLSLPMGLE